MIRRLFSLWRAPAPPRPDTIDGVPLANLSRPVRRAILANRRAEKAAALERCVSRGLSSPLRPRDQVVAGARTHHRRKDD